MRILSIVGSCAILLLLMSQPVCAYVSAPSYSVTVSPSIVINNGDNVTITFHGDPGAGIAVSIMYPGTNSSMEQMYGLVGTDGTTSFNWSVPITEPTGHYRILVSSGGVNLTSTFVDIVYDRQSYDEYLLKQQQVELQRQKGQLAIQSAYILEVHERLTNIMIACIFVCILTCIVTIAYVRHFNPYLEWKNRKEESEKKTRVGMKRTFLMFLNGSYPPDGAKFLFHPGQEKRLNLENEKTQREKGLLPEDIFVMFPDTSAAGGYRIVPVNTISQEMEEEKAEPSVETVAEEKEVEEVKASEDQLPEPEWKHAKRGKFRRFMAWLNVFAKRRRRKQLRYAELRHPMGPVDEDDEIEEKPIPAMEEEIKKPSINKNWVRTHAINGSVKVKNSKEVGK
jgi:hypothetical protein